MSPEESKRIESTVRSNVQKCEESRGQPRSTRDRKDAISSATQASLMADMGGMISDPGMEADAGSDTIPILAVGRPYPPCTTSEQDLKPITLKELKLDTHHRGHVLHVKRVAPAVTLTSKSWTIVEDEFEEVERLELVLHKSRYKEDALEVVPRYSIKEPYYTINEQGEATIRIHHPSDLVSIVDDDISRANTTPATKAKRYKDRGNLTLEKGDYGDSHYFYSAGIKTATTDLDEKDSIVSDLYRNRAHLNLVLNRFDEAKTDAEAAITGTDDDKYRLLDSKANQRAGTAAYNLADYTSAERLFKAKLVLTPDDREAKVYLKAIPSRLRELNTGEYDFLKLRQRLTPARPRVDAATFASNVTIKSSPLGGRGLFATQAIKSSSLILVEKAFHVSWSHEREAWTAMTYDSRDARIRAFPAGLVQAIVQKLLNNPSLIPAVMDLHSDYPGLGKELVQVDGNPVVDTFQVHDIIARNAFGPGAVSNGENTADEDVRHASTGLWIKAAYMNHSCVPNARKDFLGDVMIVRAERDIEAGEEITHAYAEAADYDSRQRALETTWGFECRCKLCEAEREDGEEVRNKRREKEGEAAGFVERTHSVQAKRVVIRKAEGIRREIEGTYDEKRYAGLPRLALREIDAWLEQARKK